MAKNKALDLSIRISGQLDKSLMNAINSATSQVSGLSKTVGTIGRTGLAAMGAAAAASVATIVKCTDEAAKFENEMGDVVKYVSGLADANGKISDTTAEETKNSATLAGNTYAENYNVMKNALLDLSTQIPYTAEDLTRLAAAAGQSGKTIEDLIKLDSSGNITGFLKDVAMLGTAWDISADQAGDWAAKWEVALGKNHNEIMILADQINYLGANTATTAAEIAQVVNDTASLGQITGMDPAATAAMADAMLAMGVNSARTATSIKNMVVSASLGESATDTQIAAWKELGLTAEGVAASMQENATGTWIDIFERINALDPDRRAASLKNLFGRWPIEGAAKITENLDAFINALEMVNDSAAYSGSMAKEFTIKAELPESIDTMTNSAMRALAIDVGTAFLPIKKEIGLMKLDFIDQIRDNLPDLARLAEKIMPLIRTGVEKTGNAIINALPYAEKLIDYVTDNGAEAAKIVGSAAALFGGMSFAPQIESMVKGTGSFIFGSNSTAAGGRKRNGGVLGTIQNAFGGARTSADTVTSAVRLGVSNQASGRNGIPGNMESGLVGLMALAQNWSGIFSGNKRKSQAANARMYSTIANAGENGGLSGMIKNIIASSQAGQYFAGIKGASETFSNTSIGRGILKTGGVTKEILAGIAGPEGLGITSLVGGITGLAKNAVSRTGGKAVSLAGAVKGSTAGQSIGGAAGAAGSALGAIKNSAGAGAGLLGAIWKPAAGGFLSLFSGAVPIITAVTGAIALGSIAADGFEKHIQDIRKAIGRTFGNEGLKIFNRFVSGIQTAGTFITGLFQDGGVSGAFQALQKQIGNIFGDKAGTAFEKLINTDAFQGVIQILQSVMGIVGQIVNFSTTTVKPIIQDIFAFITNTVMPIILQTFAAVAPTISAIITNLGSAVMTGMRTIGTAIQAAMPIIQTIITVFLSIGSAVIPAVLAGFEVLSQGVGNIMTAIQGIVDGLITFITGVFTGNWAKAWEGVQQIFGNAFDALVELCKTPVNAVITVINNLINGINSILGSIDKIPDWVPKIGGKEFNFQFPTIPMLAKGGFTDGISIAGEAGTEAVISFQRSVRNNNIDTWMRAGKLLGVSGRQAAAAAGFELKEIPESGNESPTIIYQPKLIFYGDAPKQDDLVNAMDISQEKFERMMERYLKKHRRVALG